jgi:tetratricopeptide (TPR) repeat protein
MKTFIFANPNSNFSKTMLGTIIGCYKKLADYNSMKNLLTGISSNKNLSSLIGLSKRFMIDYFIKQKDYTSAPNDRDLLCDVQFEKGLIYQYSLENTDEAVKCYNNILTNYPENRLAKTAKRHLKNLGIEVKENEQKSATNTNNNLTLDNYPNPFNPITKITYSLKQRDHVILIVYDILGKQVAKLVDGIQTEGEHSINFNGSNLSSGTYIYKLKGTNFNISKKMLLVK